MGLAVQMTGALLVLAAFALAQLRVLTTSSLRYLLLNLAGSAALAGSALVGRQWGFVLLNTVWCAVTVGSLVQRARGRGEKAVPPAGV
jgi:hypothetical protein